jgi:type II secretory pathway predicted ATPase ExeA
MPDIFLSQTQLLAVDFLERCVRELQPLAALTGAAGTGKTVALNTALARRESAGDRVIRVHNFVAGPLSLHRTLASSLGVVDAGELSAEALEPVLRKALVDAGQAEPPVLAVDDAQSLLPETLHYLCLLAGLREAGRPLFRILLVGRPGFTVRQSIPVQFTLEAMQPDAARQVVEHGLAAARVTATEEAIVGIVQHGQGNLRKLDLLLRASIEDARAAGRKRITPERVQIATGSRSPSAGGRRGMLGSWIAVPALLLVGVTGAVIAYQEGMFGGGTGEVAGSASPQPARVSGPAPTEPEHAPPALLQAPPSPSPASSPTVQSTPPKPAPGNAAQKPSPAPVVVAPVAPPQMASANPPPPAPSSPGPSTPTPIVVAPLPAPTPTPQAAAPQTDRPAPTPTPTANAPAASGHFRVYNISACHRGACPRWSVTDLDHRARFVAAFDPSALHLDRDTAQRVREGVLDLIVSGTVAGGGPDGRVLTADGPQSIAPHRGRLRPSGGEPIDLTGPPQPQPQTQSPPPGFLAFPSGTPPAAAPASEAPSQ